MNYAMTWVCPECGPDYSKGMYNYNKNEFIRVIDAPFGEIGKAFLFECEVCFEKYWFHATDKMVNDIKVL